MLVFLYISCMVMANLSIAFFGPWISPLNAFLLIGLDMVVRDRLHDKWLHKNLLAKMFGLIAVAGVVSYLLNPAAGMIAIASALAFVSAMAVNTVVYHFIHKKQWMVRSNVSNVGGSAADSVVFPTVAFGTFMWEIVVLQFVAKVAGGLMWSWAFKKFGGVK